MTDTEKAVLERRIDELRANMEQMRKTATMLANARTDLLVENATLRQQLVDETVSVARIDELHAELGRMQLNLDMWHDRAEDMRNRLSAAQVDKTKLQELCADLRFCKRNNCLTCSHGRFCDMHFDERFAELGIEIN